jgi:hypothetical protein
MSRRMFTANTGVELAEILATDNRPLGVAVDARSVVVAAGGFTFRALRNKMVASTMVGLLRESGRSAWVVEPLHVTAMALRGLDEGFDVHSLRNATAAEAAVIGDPQLRLAGNRQETELVSAEVMAELAASTAAVLSGLEPALRAVALEAVRLDGIWRSRVVEGWRVDHDLLIGTIDEGRDELARLSAQNGVDLSGTYSDEGSAAVLRWLSEAGVYPVEGSTPSLSDKALENLPAFTDAEALRRISALREGKSLARTATTFGTLRRAYDSGQVHAELRLFSASTGRTSIRRASIQNITRSKRGVLKARPGHMLVSVDLSQAEMRIAAGLSQDPALIRALKGDVYSETAKQIFGVDDVTPEQRGAAKKVTLAVLYGMGLGALSVQLKVDRIEAKRIFDGFWMAYPVLKAYTDRLKAATGASQFTTTLGRPIAPVAADKSYRALNSRVQAEASDVLQVRAALVGEALGASALWLQLHDELIVEVTPERVPEAMAALELMLTPFEGVPMTGTPVVMGERWSKE